MTTAVSDSKKRMVNLVASFPWVNDPGKACKILWDTLQCLLRKSLAGTLAGGHFLATLSHVHSPRQVFRGRLGQDVAAVPHLPKATRGFPFWL